MQITEAKVDVNDEEEALQGSEKDKNSYVVCHVTTQ